MWQLLSSNSTGSPRKYSERNKTSHGGNERHPYAHRRERRRAPGGAVSRFSRIMVFVAPSVACARRSWIPCDRARYARLRADGSPRTNRSVHAAPSCWRRGRPARRFRHRDSGDRRTRLGRPCRVVLRAFATRSFSRRDRFERAVHTATTRSSYQHYAPDRGRAVLSAVLPIPRHRRGGLRARCPSAYSQLPLLGFRGGPGRRCKRRPRSRYGAAPRWLSLWLDESGIVASLTHRSGRGFIRKRICAHGISWGAELVPQHGPKLGTLSACIWSAGDSPGAVHRRGPRSRFGLSWDGPSHRQSVEVCTAAPEKTAVSRLAVIGPSRSEPRRSTRL